MNKDRVDALKNMLNEDPNDPFALYGLALEYKSVGDLDAAQPLLEKSIQIDPKQIFAYYQLAEVLIGNDEIELAMDTLQRGIQVAQEANDVKAINELEALLMMIEE